MKGSPVYPLIHVHIGVWLTTWQFALEPHAPMQGSLHFWLMQANWVMHSLLLIHSGLQFGGMPENSGRQEHDGELLSTWHWELGPQGDGWHGSTDGCSTTYKIVICFNNRFSKWMWKISNLNKVSRSYLKPCSVWKDHQYNAMDNYRLDYD